MLLEKIEKYREEMVLLSRQFELTSEAVVATSMKLDRLIVEYQKYI